MKASDQFCRCCVLPSCDRSGGSIVKKCRGVSGVTGTLEKANSHFDPTQKGVGDRTTTLRRLLIGAVDSLVAFNNDLLLNT